MINNQCTCIRNKKNFILRHKEQHFEWQRQHSGMISVLIIWSTAATGGSALLPVRNFFLFFHFLYVKALYGMCSNNMLYPLLLIYCILRDITLILCRSFGQ